MLLKGIYTYDICCKDGKDHLYNSKKEIIFETFNLAEMYTFIKENSGGYEHIGNFKLKIY